MSQIVNLTDLLLNVLWTLDYLRSFWVHHFYNFLAKKSMHSIAEECLRKISCYEKFYQLFIGNLILLTTEYYFLRLLGPTGHVFHAFFNIKTTILLVIRSQLKLNNARRANVRIFEKKVAEPL